jgi:hypothetical protein
MTLTAAAAPAQVLVKDVKDPLVIGVGVDSGHQTALHAEVVMQHFYTGAMQLVVQEALEMMRCLAGS